MARTPAPQPAPPAKEGFTISKRTAGFLATAFAVMLGFAAILKAAKPIGAVIEPFTTEKVNNRITQLESEWDAALETVGRRTRELDREQDGKFGVLRDQISAMEIRLQNRMDENQKETIRLIVEAIRKKNGKL